MTHRPLRFVAPNQETWDWEELSAHCRAVTGRILRSPAAADDAAQEALLRAWRVGARADVRDPEAWLARIARNEALRVGSREAALARRQQATEEVETIPSRDDSGALWDRLWATSAFASLPLPDREVLHLRYLEELSQTEVAHRLGIPEGTAKARLHRARKRLARELRKGRG
jgi:RNA polymerase sigma-70 factor (ECF subfamily)